MKKTILFAIMLSTSLPLLAGAQPGPQPIRTIPPPRAISLPGAQTTDQSELTRFTLDFPGGTPRQLAAAIEKAMGKPLNVIVPDDFADTKLPPIKVSDVTVPQLFQTLLEGSYKYWNRGPGFNDVQSSYGFKSINGPANDSTIWTFYVYKNQEPGLTQFSIDFPGGTPKQLVAAIQKASGRPLNVIIPEDLADIKLPPLKMNDVDVNQLFRALELASAKTETYKSGMSLQQRMTSYGFRTDGKLSDDTVWYFRADRLQPQVANSPEKVCRFYPLAAILDRGLKVDDITTAAETAWKMSGETSPPSISFHKDTKLLIAVGEPEKLRVIESILEALSSQPQKAPSLPAMPEKNPSPAKPSA